MKSICLGAVLIGLGSLASCVSDYGTPIPNGVYRELSRKEAVTVKGDKLEILIRAPTESFRGQTSKREYDYRMIDNNRMQIAAPSGAWVYFYEWYWDGKRIIRKRVYWEDDASHPVKKYGETVIFTTKAAR